MIDRINIKHGLAFKLSLYLITSIITVFIAILAYEYYVTRQSIIEKTREYTGVLSDSVLSNIEVVLNGIEEVTKEIAYTIEFTELNDGELRRLLKGSVENNPEIYGCTIAFEPYVFENKSYYEPYYYKPGGVGQFYNNPERDQLYNYFKWDWYTIPKKLNKSVWSEPYFDEGGGDIRMVTFSQPFYKIINGEKKFCGVIATDVALDWLMNYVNNIKIFKTGFAFIVSKKGIFIQHRNKNYIMNESVFSMAKKYGTPQLDIIGTNMLSGKRGFDEYLYTPANQKFFISYAPLESAGWSIGIVVPINELLAELNTVTMRLFIMGLIGYFLALIIIIFLANKLTMPLRYLAAATNKIGEGNFHEEIPKINTTDEIGVLSRSFDNMQRNLIKYITNLQETTAAKEKIERELSIARTIQQSIVPHDFPMLNEFDIFATLEPAKEVGGDLYDFFFIDDRHFCFSIGDVSGKGVPAALFMAITRTLMRAKIGKDLDPAAILEAMNNDLCKENEQSMFVTIILCILDIETGQLDYCNAGHNPPAIHTKNKGFYFFSKEDPQPPLGFMSDIGYKGGRIILQPQDIFFLYTDGVTEGMDANGNQFSEKTLLDILSESKDKNVQDMVMTVTKSVELHAAGTPQSDDITLLVMKYKGPGK